MVSVKNSIYSREANELKLNSVSNDKDQKLAWRKKSGDNTEEVNHEIRKGSKVSNPNSIKDQKNMGFNRSGVNTNSGIRDRYNSDGNQNQLKGFQRAEQKKEKMKRKK